MAGVVMFSCLFGILESHGGVARYHQHREEPAESELGKCEVCGGSDTLCTHLPIICIDTGGKKVPGAAIPDENGNLAAYERSDQGETEIPVKIQIIDGKNRWNHPTDAADTTATAMFRIRGNSSRYFAKRNYRLKLVSEEVPLTEEALLIKEEKSLLGMAKGSEWSLHGPFLDKTLMRNYMWMNLSAEVMGYAPEVRFCEVLIDKEYKGVYVLMEMIREGEGRIDLTDYNDGDAVFSYMVRIEPQKELQGEAENQKTIDNFCFYTMRMEINSQMEILYPGASHLTEQVKQYVEADLSETERRLYSREMAENPDSCWDYLDMESFADYYILQEYLAINDMFYASTYFYKDVRGKLHIGPVWDYNNAWNNFLRTMPESEFLLDQKGWYGQLMKSRKFVDYVTARYKSLRRGLLSEENIETYARDVEMWLGSAVDRNFEVWGYTFDADRLTVYERQRANAGEHLSIEELNPSGYEEAMDQMLDYARVRGRWLDRNMDALYQYCHPSKNANNMFD